MIVATSIINYLIYRQLMLNEKPIKSKEYNMITFNKANFNRELNKCKKSGDTYALWQYCCDKLQGAQISFR